MRRIWLPVAMVMRNMGNKNSSTTRSTIIMMMTQTIRRIMR